MGSGDGSELFVLVSIILADYIEFNRVSGVKFGEGSSLNIKEDFVLSMRPSSVGSVSVTPILGSISSLLPSEHFSIK